MIVFEGECSEEIKKFAVNIGKKIMNFVGIFPSIPFTALWDIARLKTADLF